MILSRRTIDYIEKPQGGWSATLTLTKESKTGHYCKFELADGSELETDSGYKNIKHYGEDAVQFILSEDESVYYHGYIIKLKAGMEVVIQDEHLVSFRVPKRMREDLTANNEIRKYAYSIRRGEEYFRMIGAEFSSPNIPGHIVKYQDKYGEWHNATPGNIRALIMNKNTNAKEAATPAERINTTKITEFTLADGTVLKGIKVTEYPYDNGLIEFILTEDADVPLPNAKEKIKLRVGMEIYIEKGYIVRFGISQKTRNKLMASEQGKRLYNHSYTFSLGLRNYIEAPFSMFRVCGVDYERINYGATTPRGRIKAYQDINGQWQWNAVYDKFRAVSVEGQFL